MLEETQGLKRRGVDVVIGYFEPHGRKETIAKTEGLEFVPRKKMEYRGSTFEEMDTDAILRRAPAVCTVDEFAHTNVPGSDRAKRWEDVMTLLDAGIDVLTTMNLQHLESLNDQVWQITGIRVRETVPDWVIKQADELVMVDVTPEALINRLRRGVVYEPEKAAKALENFFREQSLVGLRELALRQAAHEVEVRHETPPSTDRLLIHITSEPTTAMLIRRGRRVADYLRAECFAVYVSETGDLGHLPLPEREAVERHLNFARNLQIETRLLQGQNAAAVLVDFARRERITQIFLMRPQDRRWNFLRTRNVTSEILRLAPDMQITVVAERGGKGRREP
jgi:two-component system sensor histidine kinase KdpD